METINNKIETVWNWCAEAYLQSGVKISFPKYTDKTKTYQWRYLSKLIEKFNDWGYTDKESIKFIRIAVKKSTKENLQRKGLSILLQGNIPEICYNEIRSETSAVDDLISRIRLTRDILIKNYGQHDQAKQLSSRIDNLPNIVRLYNNRTIFDLYISMSKSCWQATQKIRPDYDTLLPKLTTLYLVRTDFEKNKHLVQQAKAILTSDWREQQWQQR